ncbi:MAG: 4'-phosphopantetheinyl transferase superfamily protein [bacterium]|nr:4'-phosphopantetheinyl transferase superfamily protein [bacterium]
MLETYAVKLNFDTRIDRSVLDELMECVDPSKKVRLRRFVREEDRLRGLFGDLLIRDLITQKTGLANEDIEFGTNDYGKPYLKNQGDFHFNISHSGDWVVAAIDDMPVGIDIEQIQHIDLDISKNYFSNDEHRDLMGKSDRIAYFFTLWSLKESYIKILGKGLSHPLNAFSIQFIGQDEIVINVDGYPLKNVFFAQYDIDENYKMGLCANREMLPKHVNMLTMDQLIRRFYENYDATQYWYQGADSRFSSTGMINTI